MVDAAAQAQRQHKGQHKADQERFDIEAVHRAQDSTQEPRLMPEHAVEGLVAVLVMLGGLVAAWINLSSRVGVIEKVFEQHLAEKSTIMVDLNDRLHRMENKLDKVALRCAAFSQLHKLAEVRSPMDDEADEESEA